MDNPQELQVLQKLTDVFGKLNIIYAIGGSKASSVYGIVRFTQDTDITVQSFYHVADKFYDMLKDDFYISQHAMHQALKSRSSFNIIHLVTSFKIDIFVAADNDFEKQMLARSRKINLGESLEKPFSFVSPEDIILLKLRWYNQTGCTSERQWSDVLGVLAVQRKNLDFEYLKKWAARLRLNELLQQAISQSQT